MLDVTIEEAGRIARAIAPNLGRYAARYEERKYPPEELARLRVAFAKPECVQHADVVAALVWKYGHTGKANYPRHHQELANKIFQFWPASTAGLDQSAGARFYCWQKLLGQPAS